MRGGATSKEQGGTVNTIVVDSPMAAAASTLLFSCNMVGMMENMHLITRTLRMTCAHLWMMTRTTSLMDLSFQMMTISS